MNHHIEQIEKTAMQIDRIAEKFSELKQKRRKGLVTFITAGDPDHDTALAVMKALPEAGADIIELGMPFSDPMADGPAIQASNIRALMKKADMKKTLQMVRSFRVTDTKTPVILMGYFNPVYAYGTERFAVDAAEAGVDGLIVVDLPPEEESELLAPARQNGLHLIHLVTPTTDAARLDTILENAGGFIYYVSIAGITGAASPDPDKIRPAVEAIRKKSSLPVAVGFGIKTPRDAGNMAPVCDAVVVGSSIVANMAEADSADDALRRVSEQVQALSAALAA